MVKLNVLSELWHVEEKPGALGSFFFKLKITFDKADITVAAIVPS